METFDSTKRSLSEIMKDVHSGKIQLPDFQRGWIWDDNRIKGILASVCQILSHRSDYASGNWKRKRKIQNKNRWKA